MCLRSVFVIILIISNCVFADVNGRDLFGLDIGKSTELKISSATLTGTSLRLTPASVSHISRSDIDKSVLAILINCYVFTFPDFSTCVRKTVMP